MTFYHVPFPFFNEIMKRLCMGVGVGVGGPVLQPAHFVSLHFCVML